MSDAEKIIKLTDDDVFAWCFGRDQQKPALIDLINAVFTDSGLPEIIDITIANPFSIKSYKNDKKSILDIRAEDEKKNKYDIEMQSYHENFHIHRLLYYCSGMYGKQLKKNDLYNQLCPVIGISLLRPIIFPNSPVLHHFFLLKERETGEVLTDHLQLHFIELEKKRNPETGNKLNNWKEFLTNEEEKRQREK